MGPKPQGFVAPMPQYLSGVQPAPAEPDRTTIVVVNLGTPSAPTVPAVRRYLAEFLSDPRVVEAPRWLWWLALHGVILRVRPARSARAYAKIWTDVGSPLLRNSERLAERLREALAPSGARVLLAMRYGEPSLAGVLERLRSDGTARIVVLPLYPQYSATTTASVFDRVFATLARWRRVPALTLVTGYHAEPAYLDALADSVRRHWRQHPRGDRLLFSFHGIPLRYADAGDPYREQCHATARAVADRLGLADDTWLVTFQSRVGRERWLEPYTDVALAALPARGVRSVDVISPAFAVDCLETLEEIAIESRDRFLQAGGERYAYIPALNDDPAHVAALAGVVERELDRKAPPAVACRPHARHTA